MTKKELISKLSCYPDDAEIRISTKQKSPRTVYCAEGVQDAFGDKSSVVIWGGF